MLVVDLGKWMNKILIDWGIDAKVADRFDETIIAILMIAIAVGVDYLCQAILVGGMRQYTRRKPHLWNTLLMKRKVFHNLIHTIPAILVYALLPMAFMRGKELLVISQKACAIYIIFSLLLAINGILLMIMDIYDGKETMKNRPMKGFIQVLQVLLFFIGGIVIISILVNKSPASLFAGLGASAAILMLVFKDSILGFVAGIQLSANDMVRPGDWITLPSGAANGTVQEITLNTVKIQNFDNTISTVPPYTLVSSPFQNWRGMKDSGGRRVYYTGPDDTPVLYAGDARPLSERDSTDGGLSAGGRSGAHQFTGLSGVYRAVSLQSAGGESGFGFDYQSERGYHVRSTYSGLFLFPQ